MLPVLPCEFREAANKQLFDGRRFFLRPRLDPQTNQQFGEIFHARAMQALALRELLERRGDGAAFLVIAPQFGLEPVYRNMVIPGGFRGLLKLHLPILSLFRVPLQVIIYALLAPIQAHRANVRRVSGKTTGKPLPYASVAITC